MKILGDRLLVSRVEEEKGDGFQKVEVQDSFVYKGRVEQLGASGITFTGTAFQESDIKEGSIVIFAKYSPDTQEIDVEGQKMKIIRREDVLAVL